MPLWVTEALLWRSVLPLLLLVLLLVGVLQ
jgi:hypothetical protein